MDIRGIILAAGRGSRMQSLTSDKPKCMIKFAEKSLIEWQVEAFRSCGIKKIGVVTGYLNESIPKKFFDKEFYNECWDNSNMVISLCKAEDWLSKYQCIVSYGDIFFKKLAIDLLLECTSEIGITYDPNWKKLWEQRFNNPLTDAETFKIDEKSFLEDIGRSPSSYDEISGQYMGLLKFSPLGWHSVKQVINLTEDQNISMTELLNRLVKSKKNIKAIAYNNFWGEVDSLEDLSLYEKILKNRFV